MNLLIVEDDKETLACLKPSLKAEGFVVDAAEDGETGLYKTKINDYDLIILDIGLPRKNGRQVCSEIRSAGKHMPILILSVKSEIDTKAELLDAGADDYITKPFAFKELMARISALLRRPNKIEHTKLQIGDLAVDIEGRVVARGNKKLHLTAKEFSLLEYLLRNRGKVLSRQEILEHVWDMNADPFTNTIETHMVNLRKKIEGKNGKKVIHTVPGVGYKIAEY